MADEDQAGTFIIVLQLGLTEKCAVVCGSTQGIGLASAVALAGQGAQVVLLARDRDRLAACCDQLPRPFDQQHAFEQADFLDTEQLASASQRIVTRFSTVHILVNNGGGPPGGPACEADPDQFQAAFAGHLIACHLLTRAFVPGMRQAGFGRVINIISTSVKQPIPGLGVSNTIRGAVASWAKTMAGELGPLGITVNNVLPGFTHTARLQSLIAAKSQKVGRPEQQIADEMRREVPLGRFADPTEIAAAVAFLASPAASYINGINLPVDGGRTQCL